MAKGLGRRVPPNLGLSRQAHERDKDGQGGKRGAEGVDHGQQAVSECDNDKGDQGDGVEDEQQLVRLDDELGVEHGDAGGNQGGESKVD